MIRHALAALFLLLTVTPAGAQSAPLSVKKTIPLPGVTGKFDHFAYDSVLDRLFAAATGIHTVEVIDVPAGKVIQEITGLRKPHGVAWVSEEKRLFVADGALAALNIYEGTPLKLIATLPLSDDADDMAYDSATKLLYVGHGGSGATTPGKVAVVDTVKLTVVGNLPMQAHPEALEIDPASHRIFVNVADAAEVAVIDGATHTVTAHWPLTRAKDNVPVAFVPELQALLLGCRTPATVVLLSTSDGKEVDSVSSSAGADDLFYDPATRHAYLIAGSGAVDVFELAGGKFKSVGKVETTSGAKTGLWVPTRRELFVGIPSAASQPSQVRVLKEAVTEGTPPLSAAEAEDASVTSLLSTSGPTFTVPSSELPKHWSLIAYGDTRFTDPSNETVTNPFARRALVARIAELHPDALLISGDLPYDGSNPDDYQVFLRETGVWRDEHLRLYPALGNHELHKDEAREPKNWWTAFPALKGRRWYSVAFGSEYLIALDSDLPLTEGSRQQLWLADQLEHLPPETHFVFFSLHHPPVADSIEGNHSHDVRPNEKALTTFLAKQAPLSRAQFIVIAGHIHNYQRFSQDGITYLVSGGGGAKPYPIARTPADLYQDPSFPNYHYIRFNFDGKQINAAMYRLADARSEKRVWEARDTFTIPIKY